MNILSGNNIIDNSIINSLGAALRYRYAFNGMEKDDEVKGTGNSYDFGERMYDPRLGRWIKLDKFESAAPMITPYRFGLNNPIRYSDEEGDFEIDEATAAKYPNLKPALKNLLETLQKPENAEKVEMLVKLGEFENREALFEVLTDGKGPKLSVKDLIDFKTETTIVNGQQQTTTTPVQTEEGKSITTHIAIAITITEGQFIDGVAKIENQEVVIDDAVANFTEKIFNKKGKLRPFFANIFNVIIMHEVGHVGDEKDLISNSTEGAGEEVGDEFEKIINDGKTINGTRELKNYEDKPPKKKKK